MNSNDKIRQVVEDVVLLVENSGVDPTPLLIPYILKELSCKFISDEGDLSFLFVGMSGSTSFNLTKGRKNKIFISLLLAALYDEDISSIVNSISPFLQNKRSSNFIRMLLDVDCQSSPINLDNEKA